MGAKAVERGLEDWFEVAGVAADGGDGYDHIGDLFEREIVTDLMGAIRGDEERPAGGKHPGAALAKEGVAPV